MLHDHPESLYGSIECRSQKRNFTEINELRGLKAQFSLVETLI